MHDTKEIYEHRVCKDCGGPFYITVSEKAFYESRTDDRTGEPLKRPSRCYHCRKAIQKARNQKVSE